MENLSTYLKRRILDLRVFIEAHKAEDYDRGYSNALAHVISMIDDFDKIINQSSNGQ